VLIRPLLNTIVNPN